MPVDLNSSLNVSIIPGFPVATPSRRAMAATRSVHTGTSEDSIAAIDSISAVSSRSEARGTGGAGPTAPLSAAEDG